MRIEGEKTYLRPATVDDAEMIVNWRNLDEVMKYSVNRDPFTVEGHLNWVKKHIDTGDTVQFIICLKESDRPIGSTYLKDIDRTKKSAEYGVFIGDTSVRGRGIGTEVLNLTVEYAFGSLELDEVRAEVLEYNDISLRHFLHNGFHKDDEAYVNIDGKDIKIIKLTRRREERK